jgi:hypothetical protein
MLFQERISQAIARDVSSMDIENAVRRCDVFGFLNLQWSRDQLLFEVLRLLRLGRLALLASDIPPGNRPATLL